MVNIMSLLKIVECQRPVPALDMYAPSAQVLMAGPKPRYVIGLFTRLGTWTRRRTCLRTLRHEAPEAEEGGTWIFAIAPALYYHHYHCYCCSIPLYSIKLVPSSACVTITATSR